MTNIKENNFADYFSEKYTTFRTRLYSPNISFASLLR